MKLTVGTYNICHCSDFGVPFVNGKQVVSIERHSDLLKEMKFDIVGLNEVYDYGPGEEYCNQTEKLANLSGYGNYYFGKSKQFEWKDIIGNAVLSKYKITDVETFAVPAPKESERNPEENEWYEDRLIVKATVDVGREIEFISTHFGLNRSEQRRMVATLTQVLDAADKPCVLLGDFNASPSDEVLQPIYKRLKSAAALTGQTEAPTWASYAPDRTLDYIFVSNEFTVKRFEVVDKILSDHRPLRAELELSIQ